MGVEFYTCENCRETFLIMENMYHAKPVVQNGAVMNALKKMVMCENIANYIQI